jgi:hypothetical protein
LFNLLVTPSVVFDEVTQRAYQTINWLVPTLLVCLASSLALTMTTKTGRADLLGQLFEAGTITESQATTLTTHWQTVSIGVTCLGAFVGTFWSALVIWFISTVFLKCRVPFGKALEVAGLTGTLLILGTVVTGLLAAATGDPSARPAVSLLLAKLDPANPLRPASEVINVFHLWTAAVLAIGLSRLSGVSAKESGFWVFGYWIVARLGLVLLA